MTDLATEATDQEHDQGTTEPDQAPIGQDPAEATPNREAAKYRRQLRETQAQLATATERLTRIERAQATAEAAKHLAVADDLFAIGKVELDDLRDDDGDVSPERVEQAAQELLSTRPGLGIVRPVTFDGGPRQTVPAEPSGPSYSDVIRGE